MIYQIQLVHFEKYDFLLMAAYVWHLWQTSLGKMIDLTKYFRFDDWASGLL